MIPRSRIKPRQTLGKYRIERKLGDGGFAAVYRALDTLEGVRVALKIPHDYLIDEQSLAAFRHEIQLAARLNHPNILALKNADFIDGHLVLCYPMGERTLGERLQSRLSFTTAMHYAEQMLAAVAHAHEHRVIHCDIKPDNFLLFPDDTLMLTDFGIAKVAHHTIQASGSGTIGFCAPEQAMGKPSFRSDVFSLGLVFYRMLTGELPEWPFDWPPPGYERLRRQHSELIALVRRSIRVDPRQRYPDATAMLAAFERVRSKALQHVERRRSTSRRGTKKERDWKTIRHRQFQRQFGKTLATRFKCGNCDGPVSEAMFACPWCGADRSIHRDEPTFPLQCPRCLRGLKADWRYCAWCFGYGFEVTTTRELSDRRYTAQCANPACDRKSLMPFSRYCPWCRRKVKRKWKIEGSRDKCPSCGWGVVGEFWIYCPWCTKSLGKK